MYKQSTLLVLLGCLVFMAASGTSAWEPDREKYPGMKPVLADIELVPGTYKLTWNSDLDTSDILNFPDELDSDEAKSKLNKFPEMKSGTAVFGAFALDGKGTQGMLFYAVDESAGEGKGYDTAYIDMNRNLDLTDDKPVKLVYDEEEECLVTDWVAVSGKGVKPGEADLRPFKVKLSVEDYDDEILVYAYAKGTYTGTIDTNKGKIAVAAIDANSNGIYGERLDPKKKVFPFESKNDVIYADINGCGALHLDFMSKQEIPLTDVSLIAEKLYEIRVSGSGESLTIKRYSGPMGELVLNCDTLKGVDASITGLEISGVIGSKELEEYDGKPLALPAGEYKIDSCLVRVKSDSGKPIDLSCSTELSAVVKGGEKTVVSVGGQFKALGINAARNFIYMNSGASNKFSWDLSLGDGVTVMGIDGVGDATVKISDGNGENPHTLKAGYT